MKLLALGTLALAASTAHAAVNYDGCYALYRPNETPRNICLEGTSADPVDGVNARLAMFGADGRLTACWMASTLSASPSTLVFFQGGLPQLLLKNVRQVNGGIEGDATLTGTRAKFASLPPADTARLLDKIHQDVRCQGLAPDELKNLR